MDINFTLLKYFYDTYQFKSVQKAAEKNFVSQPAISQGIKKLEGHFNFELFEHKKNNLIPTYKAHKVVSEIEKLFSQSELLKKSIYDLTDTHAGSLRIGCSNSIAKSILIPHLTQFMKHYPKVDLSLVIGNTDFLINTLEQNESDLVITIDNEKKSINYKRTPVLKGQFLLVAKNNALPQIVTTEDRPEVIKLHEHLNRKKLNIKTLKIQSWDLALEMAKNNLGAAYIPDFIDFKTHKLMDISFKYQIPSFKYQVQAFCKHPHKLTQIFLDTLLNTYN
ncbi:MAG: LysR family transcriptional regulator [Pseudobdellovibrio sp.]